MGRSQEGSSTRVGVVQKGSPAWSPSHSSGSLCPNLVMPLWPLDLTLVLKASSREHWPCPHTHTTHAEEMLTWGPQEATRLLRPVPQTLGGPRASKP